MVLRRLLLALLNDPRLLDRLAEAPPIRMAARLTASTLTRGLRLRDAFLRELREEAKEAWPGGPRGKGAGPQERKGRGPQ